MSTTNLNSTASPAGSPSGERITFVVDDCRDMVKCTTTSEVYKQQKPNSVVEVAIPYYVSTNERNEILSTVDPNPLIYARNASCQEFTHKKSGWWSKWSVWSVVLGVLTDNGAVLTYVLGLDQVSPTALLSVSVVISLSSPVLRCFNCIFQVLEYHLVRWINLFVKSIVWGVIIAYGGGVLVYILGLRRIIPTVKVVLSVAVFLSSNTKRSLEAVLAFVARWMDWSFWSIALSVFIALGLHPEARPKHSHSSICGSVGCVDVQQYHTEVRDWFGNCRFVSQYLREAETCGCWNLSHVGDNGVNRSKAPSWWSVSVPHSQEK